MISNIYFVVYFETQTYIFSFIAHKEYNFSKENMVFRLYLGNAVNWEFFSDDFGMDTLMLFRFFLNYAKTTFILHNYLFSQAPALYLIKENSVEI